MKSKKPEKSKTSASIASPEVQQIEQLLHLMTEHNLEEFEYSQGDLRIRLRKPAPAMVMAPKQLSVPEIIVAGAVEAGTSASTPSVTPEPRVSDDLHLVKSPIVGTYYGAPSPGAEPFVKIGAYVDAGQTLCIVEAMKLMNEIESDASGEVIRIFIENGQPVEYNQPLFGIRPTRKK